MAYVEWVKTLLVIDYELGVAISMHLQSGAKAYDDLLFAGRAYDSLPVNRLDAAAFSELPKVIPALRPYKVSGEPTDPSYITFIEYPDTGPSGKPKSDHYYRSLTEIAPQDVAERLDIALRAARLWIDRSRFDRSASPDENPFHIPPPKPPFAVVP